LTAGTYCGHFCGGAEGCRGVGSAVAVVAFEFAEC
jgi:hypothetical protein